MSDVEEFRGKYRFLSNFYPLVLGVVLDGETYRTVEHAYQAAKTLNTNERTAIRVLSKPGEAKRSGRKVKIRRDWEAIKEGVMLDLVRQKFADKSLAALLLGTGNAELVEGNEWGDTFWGKCAGVGQNKLGKILMQVREELRP